jgi:hypothetical protein
MLPLFVGSMIGISTLLFTSGAASTFFIPLLATLALSLVGRKKFGDGASKEHYTLCRCGALQNKPFCDGMHRAINFKDDKN